jgi:hypothetical protein
MLQWEDKKDLILMLDVCILLRVLDQGEGFPSTQCYYSSFYYFWHIYIISAWRCVLRLKRVADKWINNKNTVIVLHRQKSFTLKKDLVITFMSKVCALLLSLCGWLLNPLSNKFLLLQLLWSYH